MAMSSRTLPSAESVSLEATLPSLFVAASCDSDDGSNSTSARSQILIGCRWRPANAP